MCIWENFLFIPFGIAISVYIYKPISPICLMPLFPYWFCLDDLCNAIHSMLIFSLIIVLQLMYSLNYISNCFVYVGADLSIYIPDHYIIFIMTLFNLFFCLKYFTRHDTSNCYPLSMLLDFVTGRLIKGIWKCGLWNRTPGTQTNTKSWILWNTLPLGRAWIITEMQNSRSRVLDGSLGRRDSTAGTKAILSLSKSINSKFSQATDLGCM